MRKGKRKIKTFLEDNLKYSWNAKAISNKVKLSESYVRKCLSQLLKYGTIIKEKKGFYRGIKRYFKDITEYMGSIDRNNDFTEVINDIVSKKIPLAIHHIVLYKSNLNVDYDKLNWDITAGASKGKEYKIEDDLGRTIITIYRTSSCRISFNGDVGKYKNYLEYSDYKSWLYGVISILRSYPGINFESNLDSFEIRQIGFNYDLKNGSIVAINSLKNIRIKTLNDIYELYEYKDKNGDPITRIGKHTVLPNGSGLGPTTLFPFLKGEIEKDNGINYALNSLNNINQIQKDNTIMIQLLRNSNDLQKTLVDTWPKIGDNIIEKTRLETESVKKGIKQQNDFYIAEIDKVNSDISKIHIGLRKVNDFIESQSAVIDTIIDSENRFKTEIMDVINDNQNTSKQLIGKISEDKYKEYKFLFYLLQRQLYKLPERFIEKLNESKLYLIKWFNKGEW